MRCERVFITSTHCPGGQILLSRSCGPCRNPAGKLKRAPELGGRDTNYTAENLCEVAWACVLRVNGTVSGWGLLGPVHQTEMPKDLTNAIAIGAGPAHSLALCRDGTIVAWGANISRQITVPGGLSNVTAIAAGGASSATIVAMPGPHDPFHHRWGLRLMARRD